MRQGQFDLNLLVALDALIEETSVSRAAERLGITQPGMSHVLGKLRSQLGDPILVRSAQGMEPTPFALEIAKPLKAVLADAETLLNANTRFVPEQCTLQFNLLLEDAVQSAIGAQLYRELARSAPRARLHLVRGATAGDLGRGSIDLMIWHHPLEPPFHHEQILSTPYVTIARAGHPLLDGRISLDSFTGCGHAAIEFDESAGADVEHLIDNELAASGRERDIAIKLSSFVAAIRVVERTELIATIPSMLVDKYAPGANLQVFDPPIGLQPIPIYLVWHQRTHHNPAYQWIRELVAHLVRTESALPLLANEG